MKQKLLLFLITVAMALGMQAQRTLMLTPETLFAVADSTEQSLRAVRYAVEATAKETKAAEASRLPDISVSLSASYLGDGYVWNRNFSNGMAVDIPHFGANFALSASQIIYAGGAVSNGIALSKQGHRMAELDYAKSRQQVYFRLLGDYLNLLKAQSLVLVYDENIGLAERVITHLEAKHEQGTVLQNALTRYELQLENLKLQRMRIVNACTIYNRQLLKALDLDEDIRIVADSGVMNRHMAPEPSIAWHDRAANGSIDLQQMEAAVTMSRLQERVAQAERLPKVALFAQEHLDGPVTIEVPVLNKNFNYWVVGVGISYNISSLYKTGEKVRAARLNTQRALAQSEHVEEQVGNAVEEAYIRLCEAENEVEVRGKSVELAKQNYDITAKRYVNDLALLTDMLDASNAVLAAELELKNARINRLFCHYKLQFVCGEL